MIPHSTKMSLENNQVTLEIYASKPCKGNNLSLTLNLNPLVTPKRTTRPRNLYLLAIKEKLSAQTPTPPCS